MVWWCGGVAVLWCGGGGGVVLWWCGGVDIREENKFTIA